MNAPLVAWHGWEYSHGESHVCPCLPGRCEQEYMQAFGVAHYHPIVRIRAVPGPLTRCAIVRANIARVTYAFFGRLFFSAYSGFVAALHPIKYL